MGCDRLASVWCHYTGIAYGLSVYFGWRGIFVCYLVLKPVGCALQLFYALPILLRFHWCLFTILDLTVLSKSASRLAFMRPFTGDFQFTITGIQHVRYTNRYG